MSAQKDTSKGHGCVRLFMKIILRLLLKDNKFVTGIHISSRQVVRDDYIEDITRWREDMNFMFEWQTQYLTSERSSLVRYSIVFATRT